MISAAKSIQFCYLKGDWLEPRYQFSNEEQNVSEISK